VLSGALDDGTAGLRAVRVAGGVGVVQNPAEAAFGDMPRSAARYTDADKVVGVEAMPQLIVELVRALPGAKARSAEDPVGERPHPAKAELADLTCPSCRGSLREQDFDGRTEYECRIGHRFSENTLLLGQSDQIDAALWSALAALEERADLCRRMSVRRRDAGHDRSATRYDVDAEQAESQASLLRHLLLTGQLDPAIATDDDVEDAR
jgi:two-component system chemotaxis response regulator CheB